MTKSDVLKEFLKKTVIPVVVALFLFSMFSRIFVENGEIVIRETVSSSVVPTVSDCKL